MTALNLWTTPTAGHILSDAAVYDHADGRVIAWSPKVVPMPHIKAAFGVSGYLNTAEVSLWFGRRGGAKTARDLTGLNGPGFAGSTHREAQADAHLRRGLG